MLEFLQDPSKRGTAEGEFPLLVHSPGPAGRREIRDFVIKHNARVRLVNETEAADLSRRFKPYFEDIRTRFHGNQREDRSEPTPTDHVE